ncbi:MAG: hypothetical protein K9M55_02240 [Candidatus Marinimicrobia bacterium]|nr:hypothetical protein [Candidatus Neomarinimicrobiota bacterium]MCF7921498.1 hypothetical protein [Candidatus Neomarinimicrobiota bacterium]
MTLLRFRSTILPVVLIVLLPLMGLSQKKKTEGTSKGSTKREFFQPSVEVRGTDSVVKELRKEVSQIQNEMDRMRNQLREYDDLSAPRIRKEIKRLVNFPEKISEITLKNGTVVQGKILSEDLDKIIVQTNIGTLSIVQENIKELKPFDRLHADVVLKGEFEDQRHAESRVFIGQITNKGMRRADFVRVQFRLHDKRTTIIAQDSSYISGEAYSFYSGVISESSLSPGESSLFRVEVKLPPGFEAKNISYVTYKILFDEFN